MTLRSVCMAALGIAMASCSASEESGSSSPVDDTRGVSADARIRTLAEATSTRDSAGIRIIENWRPVLDRFWRIDELPQLKIGAEFGAPEYELSRVIGAGLLSNGTLAIADGATQEVRWYDSSGRFLHRAGGNGQGPGEFLRLSGFFRIPGDSIIVGDLQQDRYTVFGPNGEWVRTESYSVSVRGAVPRARLPDGSYASWPQIIIIADSGPTRIERLPLDLFRIKPASGVAEHVGTFPGVEVTIGPTVGLGTGGVVTIGRFPRVFGRNTIITTGLEGWIVGDNDRAELQLLSPAGDLLALVRWAVEARNVTSQDLERERASQLAGVVDPNAQRRVRERWEEHPAPPARMPVFNSILTDSEGNIWVGNYTPNGSGEATRYQVFDPSGVWLASVEAPRGVRIVDVASDRVAGIVRGELDVESVVVYRLERP